jgi:carboxyl-terminal processing protease
MRTTRTLLLAFAAALGTAAPAAAQSDHAAARISPAEAVATFDSAWSRVRNAHYDTAMRGVDWTRVREELRPRAERATTLAELRGVLSEMLARLGESHYGVIPKEVEDVFEATGAARGDSADTPPGDVGLSVRLLGSDVVVSRVEAGGPADRAGVKLGWIVDSVGAFTARRNAERVARLRTEAERRLALLRIPAGVASAFGGAPGSVVRAAFRDGAGRRVVATLTRRAAPGDVVHYPNLPTFVALVEHELLPLAGGGCVGVIRFNIWMPSVLPQFDRAMDAVRDCRGIVLDLRGNPGGAGAMVMGIGGHFLDSAVSLGTMRTRGNELHFVVNPRRANTRGEPVRPYAGPLAIVVDPLTGSTSEIFTAGLQAVGRARVFGEPSAGQALPAMATRLPTGDVLLHVIADFVAPNGRRVEGRGVVPDERVPLRRTDLLAGRDAALEAAVAWAGKRGD